MLAIRVQPAMRVLYLNSLQPLTHLLVDPNANVPRPFMNISAKKSIIQTGRSIHDHSKTLTRKFVSLDTSLLLTTAPFLRLSSCGTLEECFLLLLAHFDHSLDKDFHREDMRRQNFQAPPCLHEVIVRRLGTNLKICKFLKNHVGRCRNGLENTRT